MTFDEEFSICHGIYPANDLYTGFPAAKPTAAKAAQIGWTDTKKVFIEIIDPAPASWDLFTAAQLEGAQPHFEAAGLGPGFTAEQLRTDVLKDAPEMGQETKPQLIVCFQNAPLPPVDKGENQGKLKWVWELNGQALNAFMIIDKFHLRLINSGVFVQKVRDAAQSVAMENEKIRATAKWDFTPDGRLIERTTQQQAESQIRQQEYQRELAGA